MIELEEDEIEFNLKNSKYLYIGAIIILMIVVIWLGYNNLQNSKSLGLIKDYQNGFAKCNDYCKSEKLIGYIRAVDDMHHKCFCYNNSDNTLRCQIKEQYMQWL